MALPRILRSAQDRSSNFVTPFGKGFLESRLVMRPPKDNHNNHLSFYVSSHSGCQLQCQMCHLTHTGQRSFLPADESQLTAQLNTLLAHYTERFQSGELPKATDAYINFMARGEPLLNPSVQQKMPSMFDAWQKLFADHDLTLRVNISSIMPKGISRFETLQKMFGSAPVHMYYSLYSLQPTFRSHWLPNSMEPERALDLLKGWEESSGIPITFHWPIIDGHNDSDETIDEIATTIKDRQFQGRYHLVRFNPPAPQYKEATEERMNYALLRFSGAFPNPCKSKAIQRVGEDVHASCGTFWAPQ